MIFLVVVDEIFVVNLLIGLGLEYEQQMKGFVEDYEEKIEKFEIEFEEE